MNQKYRTINTYNLDKIYIDLDNSEIPIVKNDNYIPKDLIGFNEARKNKSKCVGIHFYLDDYQFERIWNQPERYINLFKEYECILTPDFSLYTDMPLPMKIWNTYRSRFLGQYYQKHGIKVIPTISWADIDTYDFCFKGIPEGSIVSISTIGVKKNKKALKLWKSGVDEMIYQIKPSSILIYGDKIDYDFKDINIKYYENKTIKRLELNTQKFGGRGASSGLKKMPKNKTKAINTYNKRIEQHEAKIKKALNGEPGYSKITIPHWQNEINTFKKNIEKIERRYKK